MTRILVLGAGRVGAAIAADLAVEPGYSVTAADRSGTALERAREAASRRGARSAALATRVLDSSEAAAVSEAASEHDLVVGALPGFMGFDALRAVLEAGRPCVDISFFPEDPFELDALAREMGVPAVVDAGVAPGLSNLAAGHFDAVMDATDSFACMVGGLPVERRWPFEYKAPFSPVDVIEEYTRPARLRRAGREVVLPALSELELVDLPGVGTLEAFVTDGLRTLLRTVETPTLSEKTLRWPGHAERMRMLREAGFFGEEPVDVDGARVRPRDLTARLLFDAWRLDDDDEELTVMRVEVEGTQDGRPTRHVLDLLDRRDAATGTSSMARTTGYTCTAFVKLVAEGAWSRPGIAPPEIPGGQAGVFDAVLEHLRERGVEVRLRRESLPAS